MWWGALGVTNLNVYVSHACGLVVALDVWVFQPSNLCGPWKMLKSLPLLSAENDLAYCQHLGGAPTHMLSEKLLADGTCEYRRLHLG